MVETDDDDAKDQAPEGNLRNCTLRENNVKEQVEGVVLQDWWQGREPSATGAVPHLQQVENFM